jgi:hypothetical protein
MGKPNVRITNQKGEGGGVVAEGNEVVTPVSPNTYFDTILATQDSVLDLTASNLTGDSIAAFPLKAGNKIYGLFKSVQFLSGAGVCYNQT